MADISVRNITKSYGKVKALDGVSFEVGKGQMFGLIGPDGAGKTTLFRILATLLLPDTGSAEILGLDAVTDYREIRSRIGYMPGKFSLYQDLTVEENLSFFASLFSTTVRENYHLVEDIYRQIEPFKDRKAGNLSGGMKQKLALCCAMIHRPEVLFLDEPTTGVDPVSRKEFWQMLKRLKQDGITIIVSTPYMDEAALCDTIALMADGHFLKTESPENITAQYDKDLYSISVKNKIQAMRDFSGIRTIEACYPFGERLHIVVPHGTDSLIRDLQLLGYDGAEQTAPTIEDCFMELSKRKTL